MIDAKLLEIHDRLELSLRDVSIESMFLNLLEHSSVAEKYDTDILTMARSQTVSFLGQYVDDLDFVFRSLGDYIAECKASQKASE